MEELFERREKDRLNEPFGMFGILENEYPFLKFYPKVEVTLTTEVIADDNDAGDSDSKTVIRAAARVDVIVEAEPSRTF